MVVCVVACCCRGVLWRRGRCGARACVAARRGVSLCSWCVVACRGVARLCLSRSLLLAAGNKSEHGCLWLLVARTTDCGGGCSSGMHCAAVLIVRRILSDDYSKASFSTLDWLCETILKDDTLAKALYGRCFDVHGGAQCRQTYARPTASS